jgi:hypothetical protein
LVFRFFGVVFDEVVGLVGEGVVDVMGFILIIRRDVSLG